jgi:hypothetical protein
LFYWIYIDFLVLSNNPYSEHMYFLPADGRAKLGDGHVSNRSYWSRDFWEASVAVRASSNGISPRLARQDIDDLARVALFGPANIGARAVDGIAEATQAPNVGARRAALWELANLECRSEFCADAAGKALADVSSNLPPDFVSETLSGEYRRRPEDRRRRRVAAVVRRASAAGDDEMVRRAVGELLELAQWAVPPVNGQTVEDIISMLDWPNDAACNAAYEVLQQGIKLAFNADLAQRAYKALQRHGLADDSPPMCA